MTSPRYRTDRVSAEREKSHIVLMRPPASALDMRFGRIYVAMRTYACEPSASDAEWVDRVPDSIGCPKCQAWWDSRGASIKSADQSMAAQREINIKSFRLLGTAPAGKASTARQVKRATHVHKSPQSGETQDVTEQTQPSLIDVDLGDARPLRTLPDNQEARLTVVRAELELNKSQPQELGVYNLHLWLDSGESDVDDIQTWIPVPNAAWKQASYKEYTKATNRFAEFCQALGFTPPVTSDRLVGLSGWALLSEEEDRRTPGVMRNGIRRWISR